MVISRSVAAVVLTAVVAAPIGFAPSAQAAPWAVTDSVGDAGGASRLDIVTVQVRNADRRIVTRVRFAKPVAGKVLVSLDPRGGDGVLLIAVRRKDGTVRSSLVPGAFTDRKNVGSGSICPHTELKVRWRASAVRLVLPSKCVNDGDYGAIRFQVLTENGADSDYAPHNRQGDLASSRWIPRG